MFLLRVHVGECTCVNSSQVEQQEAEGQAVKPRHDPGRLVVLVVMVVMKVMKMWRWLARWRNLRVLRDVMESEPGQRGGGAVERPVTCMKREREGGRALSEGAGLKIHTSC